MQVAAQALQRGDLSCHHHSQCFHVQMHSIFLQQGLQWSWTVRERGRERETAMGREIIVYLFLHLSHAATTGVPRP